MANLIQIDVAHRETTWPGENPNILWRRILGPRGQIELINTRGWGAGDYMPGGAEVQITVEGKAGARSYTLDVSQITSSPSIFASAVETPNDPITAINNINLENWGVTIEDHKDIFALEVAVYYMKTGRVNTAFWKPRFSTPTKSASGFYEFDFQVHCILLAQKLRASKLVQVLTLEIRREWLGFPFRVKHFEIATNVNGALDQFLIDWMVESEHEKDEELHHAKEKALVRGLENVSGLRSMLSLHFTNKPESKYSALNFASQVLEATLAKMQADASKAAAAHAKAVAEAAAQADTEHAVESADEDEEGIKDVTKHVTKSDDEGEGVTKAVPASSESNNVAIASYSAEHQASHPASLPADEGAADTLSPRITLKLNGPKPPPENREEPMESH